MNGNLSGIPSQTRRTIFPASFRRISPYTTLPNSHNLPCAAMEMKYAPARE